ncbi:LacI family DNA-binding transcriptional regulator [Microbacterium sp. Leaf288]|uniref:LacI family DNA-binding transcriptional regulator n=1 Tax=Microbacterium sp. Leaf288 TaxID=1736323 RepID=UPI0009EC4FB7|nr:LacI family DNA-binding transcriptional regulator [Microbacterium sp. Leaf288]
MTQVRRSDVARAAGVSPAVVSYVLNGGPRPVSTDARRRVEAAIAELGYRPNKIAQALRGTRTHSIAMLMPDHLNPHFAELAQAMEDEAQRRGYVLIIGTAANDVEREQSYLRSFLDRQVDGVVLISAAADPDVDEIERAGIPLVLLDRAAGGSSRSSVVTDNCAAAALGVRHLQEHGCTRLRFLSGPAELEPVRDRDRGWSERTGDASLERVWRSAFSREAGYEAVRSAVARSGIDFDGLFTASDAQAIGALKALREAGARVPEDVAVVSLDGSEASLYTLPTLTAVVQDVGRLAADAVEILVARATGVTTTPVHHILQPSLRRMDSCGCGTSG